MFKNLALFVFLLAATAMSAQVSPTKIVHPDEAKPVNENGPIMQFETKTVDYGTIEQHSDPLRVIKFTNVGKEPLIIKNARGSCGCTVPTWPKEAIAPGETGEIKVRYATNRLNKFTKSITLTTNEANPTRKLTIKGEVLPKPTEEAIPSSGSGF